MKLSLAWIFYHINADWKKIDIKDLVSKFNKTTAEIESYKKINTDLSRLFIAKVIDVASESVILFSPEIKKEIELPRRENIAKDQIFLIAKNNDNFQWAKSTDLGSEKDFVLPELFLKENFLSGKWKDDFEVEDYIIEVDNKSVTHRPDLWGHRGFAREIAAILNLELLPIEEYIESKEIISFGNKSKSNETNPFSIMIENENVCKRFGTIFIKQIKNIPSILPTVTRLCRIDSRSINAIVDVTNYVMFDLGQPMHAFDADKIRGKSISPRFAKKGEKLTLLDNETIELTNEDLVIADEQGPIALAGIMGGKNTEVDSTTKSLLIESACFDATTIRRSSIRFKKRTEASARFEKSLDPNQNILAIERFLKILNFTLKFADEYIDVDKIISLGKPAEKKIIEIDHEFIEKRLGTKISSEFIISTLEKLDFKVEIEESGNNKIYKIVVPTFRSSKDVAIPEDIVEEVGRFFGYDKITFVLPYKQMIPSDINQLVKIRKIKELMAYACGMHEVQNYPFFDESFLHELQWKPDNTVSVINPVSENWRQLVTSLIPHLLKNIQQNLGKEGQINFFEFNRIWHFKENKIKEKKVIAGIFFDHKNSINFYDSKAKLNLLFDLLKIKVDWKKRTSSNEFVDIWYSKYQAADLICDGKKIGIAGIISQEFLNKITQGDAFIFEIDADFLIEKLQKIIKFKPLSKYPSVWLDISIFVNLDKTVEQITNIIKNADVRIYKVELLDIFEKLEWKDKKSLTLRYHFVDDNKTLTKEEIDQIADKVNNEIKKLGAQLR